MRFAPETHSYWLQQAFARAAARSLRGGLARATTFERLSAKLRTPHMRVCATACLGGLLLAAPPDDDEEQQVAREFLSAWLVVWYPHRVLWHPYEAGHTAALREAAAALLARFDAGVARLAAGEPYHLDPHLTTCFATYLAAFRAWRVLDAPRAVVRVRLGLALLRAALAAPNEPYNQLELLERLAVLEAAHARLLRLLPPAQAQAAEACLLVK